MLKDNPTREEVEDAVRRMADAIRARADVVTMRFFGSRARGDHRPDSDADLAVVLRGLKGSAWEADKDWGGLTIDIVSKTGVWVEPIPIKWEHWEDPQLAYNPYFIEAIQTEGIDLW